MNRTVRRVLILAALLAAGMSLAGGALAQPIPPLSTIAPALAAARPDLMSRRATLASERDVLRARREAHNARCSAVTEGTPEDAACDAPRAALRADMQDHAAASRAFNAEVAAGARAQASAYFYALQSRTLTPMPDQGHPLDAPGAPAAGLHGLVGGTTWTYGFRGPAGGCAPACRAEIDRRLGQQLALHCSSQSDPPKCLQDGLPFTKENYDLVVSMASSHSAIEDLATRVVWDGAAFGEFSRQHQEIFASLKGRQFDVLDCHSNGAMLCLAALRSGETTAKSVRLFGPQINAESAALWSQYAAATGAKLEIYINAGDPIPAASWAMPAPQTAAGKLTTAAWIATPPAVAGSLATALLDTWRDSKTPLMTERLEPYGLAVTRSEGCKGGPDLACHSMVLYERNLAPSGPGQ
jgi:hypothetical protein